MTFKTDLLLGRRILVTGGGTGLGRAMVERFLTLGATVVICGRRGDILQTAKEELGRQYPGAVVETHVCDVRDMDAIEAMMEAIWQGGALDILVNNAAANFLAQTHLLSARAIDAVLDVTMRGALGCTIAAGRRWISGSAPGVVLSILSTSPVNGRPFTVPSAMAKSAILTMTKSLAVEWGPRGIRLVAIAPGSFPTPGAVARLNPSLQQSTDSTLPQDFALRTVPLGRIGQHSELADLAAFMVSPAAAYMTGEMVVLDGGAYLKSASTEEILNWSDDEWGAYRKSARAGQ